MPRKTAIKTRRAGSVGVRPARSNAGGALRGAARAAAVKAMNSAKREAATTRGTNPVSASVAARAPQGSISLTKQADTARSSKGRKLRTF